MESFLDVVGGVLLVRAHSAVCCGEAIVKLWDSRVAFLATWGEKLVVAVFPCL